MKQTLVDIALPYHSTERLRTLSRPSSQQRERGERVLVPFGKRSSLVSSSDSSEFDAHLLEEHSRRPRRGTGVSPEMLQLTRWIGEYYLAPWARFSRQPRPGLSTSSKVRVKLVAKNVETLLEETRRTAKIQNAILRGLKEAGELSLSRSRQEPDEEHPRRPERDGAAGMDSSGRTPRAYRQTKTENVAILTAPERRL